MLTDLTGKLDKDDFAGRIRLRLSDASEYFGEQERPVWSKFHAYDFEGGGGELLALLEIVDLEMLMRMPPPPSSESHRRTSQSSTRTSVSRTCDDKAPYELKPLHEEHSIAPSALTLDEYTSLDE